MGLAVEAVSGDGDVGIAFSLSRRTGWITTVVEPLGELLIYD